ncbi:hypothetical protein Tco_1019755 [Tanacetum coccineum]|uniref:Uncharacterized protein n=1 Tax=Tanacetum coccineum TaxID=301880 RepID=A0ABQ5FYC6_9ASTR
MAISNILISSDSSKESTGTPFGQVLWFGRIPTTVPATTPTVTPPTTHIDTTLTPIEIPTISPIVPPSPNYTPASLDYSPASDMEPNLSEDPSSGHILPLLATSPFLSSTDDSSDSDTPNTPPSPTHEILPAKVVPPAIQILPAPFGVCRKRVAILSPGQPIPYGQPYRYHPNGLVHMMTARKRVGPLLTHCLTVRHSVDYSSSDYFTFDDSSRDSPSNSSSETPSDFYSDALYDFSSGHSSSDHPSSALPSSMRYSHQLCSLVPSIPYSTVVITDRPSHSSPAALSRKRSRSTTTSILLSLPIPGVLSSVRADLLPPRKRIRSPEIVKGLEDCSDEGSESSVPSETGSRADIEAEIDECIAYSDALRAEGIDVRVVVETIAREEVETSARGTVMVSDDRVMHPVVLDDIPEPAQEEGAVEVTYEMLGDLGHKIVASSQQGTVMSKRISDLEWDNTRLRGTLDVASQRVTRL